MIKWRIAILALPLAGLVLVLRYLLHDVAGKSGFLAFSDTGAVITGTALIVGLMLTGVIADYKESEKLPTAVSSGLLDIRDYAVRGLNVIDQDDSRVRAILAPVAHAINDWFYGRKSSAELWAAYNNVNQLIDDVAKLGATDPYVDQLHNSNNALSGALNRITTIRDTSFVKAGYALLEILVFVVLMLMVIADFPAGAGQYVVPTAISILYVYMLLFIKDLDNPFGYADNNGKGSSADVDLTPWHKAYAAFTS